MKFKKGETLHIEYRDDIALVRLITDVTTTARLVIVECDLVALTWRRHNRFTEAYGFLHPDYRRDDDGPETMVVQGRGGTRYAIAFVGARRIPAKWKYVSPIDYPLYMGSNYVNATLYESLIEEFPLFVSYPYQSPEFKEMLTEQRGV